MSRNYFEDFSLGHAWGQNQFVDRPRALKENAENRAYLNETRGNELEDRRNLRSATDQYATDEKQRQDVQQAQTREGTRAAMAKIKHALFDADDPREAQKEVMESLNDPAFQGLRDKFTGGQPIIGGGLGEDGRVGLVFDRGDGQSTGFSIPYEDFADTVLEYGMQLDPEYARQLGAEDNVPAPGLGDATRGLTGELSPLEAAVMGTESNFDPRAVSPKGAEGTMQTMPETQGDPGYGVTPVRDDSDKEKERLGRDYLAAMQKEYPDNLDHALAAYNWGPGNVDRWIARGANPAELPKETQDYIVKVNGQLNGTAQGQPQPGLRDELPVEELPAQPEGLSAGRQAGGSVSGMGQDEAVQGQLRSLDGRRQQLEAEVKTLADQRERWVAENPGADPSGMDQALEAKWLELEAANEEFEGAGAGRVQHGRKEQWNPLSSIPRPRMPETESTRAAADRERQPASTPRGLEAAKDGAPSAQDTPPPTPRAERQGLMAGLGLSQADLQAVRVDTAGQRAGGGGSKRPTDASIDAAAEFLFQGKIGLDDFQRYARTGSFGEPADREKSIKFDEEGGYVYDPNDRTTRWVGPEGGPRRPDIKWSDIGARDKELARIMGYEDSSDFGFLREKGMWDVSLAASGQNWEEWFSSPGGESAFRQVNTAQRAIERGGQRWWNKLPFAGVDDKHFSRTLAIQLVTSGEAAGGSDREVYEASEALKTKYYVPLQEAWEASGRKGQLSAEQASVFTQGMIEMEHALQFGPGAVQEVLRILESEEVNWNADRMQQQLIQMRESRTPR